MVRYIRATAKFGEIEELCRVCLVYYCPPSISRSGAEITCQGAPGEKTTNKLLFSLHIKSSAPGEENKDLKQERLLAF